jgi:tRNA threonylcarbamoyladenosine biosynthesis protein TsaB
MVLLAIDTTMAACSAAVLWRESGEERMVSHFEAMERGHAEALFPMVATVMTQADIAFSDVTKIAVTVGPGTFTGVRAGIAAARGFALAAKCPIVGVGSLEVMAQGGLRQISETPPSGDFIVTHDARRGEYYCQRFDTTGHALSAPAVLTALQAVEQLSPNITLLFGNGAAAVKAAATPSERNLQALLPRLLPDSADLARLAFNLPHCEIPPSPLYLRAPDAKPQSSKVISRV